MYEHDTHAVERMVAEVIVRKVTERSMTCERGPIAYRSDGRAGLALIGPDCILYAEIFHPELPPFDFCLN